MRGEPAARRRVPAAARRVALAGPLVAVSLAACGGGAEVTQPPSPSPTTGNAGVSLGGTPSSTVDATNQLQFSPPSVTVKAGRIVEWKNVSSVLHTVTFSNASLSDSALQPGSTWEVRFTQPGTYLYRCTIHAGMQGTVVVVPAG